MKWSPKTASRQVEVTVPSTASLLADLADHLKRGAGFCVATINLDHVVKLKQSKPFHDAYASHTHVTADGNPIVWFSRLAGTPVELVPGSELIIPITKLCAELDRPIALFGGNEKTLTLTAAEMQRQFPALKIAATIAPPMGFDPTGEQADAYIEELRASGAALCFVALGAPKQEIFAQRAFEAVPHLGLLSIGAGLDFIAGTQKRAPAFVRAVASEWLWRLMTNPRRFAGRYAGCIAILPALTWRALQTRRKQS